MKKASLLCIALGVLIGCNKDSSNTELTGKWKLIEVLADPGDGSGTFNVVSSQKTITFNNNGTLNSNGLLCDMSIESNTPTNGTYSILQSTFNSSDCLDPNYDYMFEQNENILIIDYPCFEKCQAKYKKQ